MPAPEAIFTAYAEKHPEILEWAVVDGITAYAVTRPHPGQGLRWVQYTIDRFGDVSMTRMSGGAFYDDVEEHPEGALEWARTCARAYHAKVKGWEAEFMAGARRDRPDLFPAEGWGDLDNTAEEG